MAVDELGHPGRVLLHGLHGPLGPVAVEALVQAVARRDEPVGHDARGLVPVPREHLGHRDGGGVDGLPLVVPAAAGAVGGGVEGGEHRGEARQGPRRRRARHVEAHALVGERLQVRGRVALVAEGGHVVRAQGVDADEQDVRRGGGLVPGLDAGCAHQEGVEGVGLVVHVADPEGQGPGPAGGGAQVEGDLAPGPLTAVVLRVDGDAPELERPLGVGEPRAHGRSVAGLAGGLGERGDAEA